MRLRGQYNKSIHCKLIFHSAFIRYILLILALQLITAFPITMNNKGDKRGSSCFCSSCDDDENTTTPNNKSIDRAQTTINGTSLLDQQPTVFLVTPSSSQRRPLTRKPLTDHQAISSLLHDTIQYDTSSSQKRETFLSWEDYFMSIAELSARRSKDPETPSGACLVHDQRVIAIGYNGFPMHCSDDVLPWQQTTKDHWLHGPSPYVVHAVANAVLNRRVPHKRGPGTILYTRHFPCHECAKVIAQTSDITTVVYALSTTCGSDPDSEKASRIMLQLAGVHVEQHVPSTPLVEIDFRTALNPTEQEEIQPVPPLSSDRKAEHVELMQREAGYHFIQSHKRRRNVLTWDDYFMALAFLTAQRSKDPNTTVGACIVDSRRHIVGLGYNGFPAGCSDDVLPWHRQGASALHTKYMYVCHAEVNAILNAQESCEGATIYVALFPCHACAQYIIQSRIAKVVYASDQYHDTESARASRILLQMAGVELQQYRPSQWNWTLPLGSDAMMI
ncbi:dCMP deaminase [Fistulifera solaris]|uniref:dCMP deaminase n=1 Tax=Fistulifera solaris TaxID=1519565 RepID=A0A1Z5K0U6_FISSO|nr:dCMP deaminase [Fistulifera solaris]|eukprot:GAX19762.1 dCMP deaminase [Fistulifera solaris]